MGAQSIWQDQVPRQREFEAVHPEIRLFSDHGYWYAERDGHRIAGPCILLKDILDRLDALFPGELAAGVEP